LDALAAHVSALEALVFKHPVIIPDPPFPAGDHIDPALIQVSTDPHLSGVCAARRVPPDYYERPLDYRRDCLGAQSVDQLCKCVLFEIKDSPDPLKRFVCAVVQYTDKISQPKLLAVCAEILHTRVSNLSLAKEEDAIGLSGSQYNGMTPVFMRPQKAYAQYSVALILSSRIAGLDPRFFWLGGGEVDVKFGVATVSFILRFSPQIRDISA
jgi:hypothetical protein